MTHNPTCAFGYIGQVFNLDVGDLNVEDPLREGNSPVSVDIFRFGIAFELRSHRSAARNRAGTHNSILLLRKVLRFWFSDNTGRKY